MRPRDGDLIGGKYRVVRLIGDGGMGSVYEARHEYLGTAVALKFLHPELARRQGLVARFLQEARVSASIRSHHVAHVTDVDQAGEGAAYLVMELLVGDSLARALEQNGGRLPKDLALDFTMQILAGLEAAHAAGVVHRDLKPDNVFIVTTPRGPLVKLLDFGIAKLRTSREFQVALTRPGVMMGTPEYMAPEQVYSADQVDARADIYAVGTMLYEMLAGKRPTQGETAQEISAFVLSGKVPPLDQVEPSVPEGLARVVARALAPNPEQRWASAPELRDALRPYCGVLSVAGQFAATPPHGAAHAGSAGSHPALAAAATSGASSTPGSPGSGPGAGASGASGPPTTPLAALPSVDPAAPVKTHPGTSDPGAGSPELHVLTPYASTPTATGSPGYAPPYAQGYGPGYGYGSTSPMPPLAAGARAGEGAHYQATAQYGAAPTPTAAATITRGGKRRNKALIVLLLLGALAAVTVAVALLATNGTDGGPSALITPIAPTTAAPLGALVPSLPVVPASTQVSPAAVPTPFPAPIAPQPTPHPSPGPVKPPAAKDGGAVPPGSTSPIPGLPPFGPLPFPLPSAFPMPSGFPPIPIPVIPGFPQFPGMPGAPTPTAPPAPSK